ncbi:DUF1549 domain-containing protein [Telmatocola sphagniphila]|nr:DUF1549 domain-containing protein [Telmatocola sphagniphila]
MEILLKPLSGFIAILSITALHVSIATASDGPAPTVEVQAILDLHCVKCHGPLEDKAGLRLDTAAGLWKGSENGAIVKAGNPEESKLFQVLAKNSDPHMPPKKQLSDAEIAKVRAWVAKPVKEARVVKLVVPAEPSAAIDAFLAEGWKERKITPAPLCDDLTFLRRVSLDLIGRIPTPEETSAFQKDQADNKRAILVDRLMASSEAARNFREIWDVLLMGRQGGRREQQRRDSGWYTYLENAYKQNRPWDEVVRGFITARPERPEDKGAVWFLFERKNEHQQIAEALAPIIYGTRIDCAQCHDHPLAAEIKQGHYWGLVAAFNRSKNVEAGPSAVREMASGGFMNFTNLKKESQPASITLLTGKVISEARPENDDLSGLYLDPMAKVKVPKFSRRAALAEAATRDNPLLARSFVNHTWALLMGRGIVDPPDEMNSKHPPSHPELLDWLSEDFAKHQYDVRRLLRAIVLSRGYQLAMGGHNAPPPDAFACAMERPLTGEAITRSARISAGQTPDDEALRKAVVERFPDVMPRTSRATIQQAMFLSNSERVAALFKSGPAKIIADEAGVRALFRRALIREPDKEELAHSLEFLKQNPNPSAAAGQLLWALVAGPEFLTNH